MRGTNGAPPSERMHTSMKATVAVLRSLYGKLTSVAFGTSLTQAQIISFSASRSHLNICTVAKLQPACFYSVSSESHNNPSLISTSCQPPYRAGLFSVLQGSRCCLFLN